MADNRDPPETINNPVKLDQVRNMPGGALLRTIPSTQGRFMMAGPQVSTALISTTTTIQTQVLPKVTGPGSGSSSSSVSRISTVPIQATTTTGYHVPRGAAAVANISVPRSSVATPIVRAPTSLQTIGVAQQHSLPSSGTSSGRSVVGVTCLPSQPRPPPLQVGTRLVSSQIRPIGDVQARPVLVHAATHKQVTLTQQQVQSTLQMSGAVKSYSNATRHPGTPSLSRITAATLPPGMVSLPVFLPSQPIKPQPQPKVIAQSSHGSSVQIPSVTSSVPQTLSISTVVSRPVVIGSGTVGTAVRPVTKPTAVATATPVPDASQQLYIPGRSTILVRETPRTKESEPISISVSSTQTTTTTTSAGVNTIYTLPGPAYFEGSAVRPLVTLAPASRTTQGVPTTSQPMRLNSLMVVEQPTPRIHTLVSTTSSENSQGTITNTETSSVTTCAPGVSVPLPKQVTSPRPSILRKRDPDGLVTSSISLPKKSRSPMKGAKNLTPLLTGLGSGSSPPTLPPSPPPKRPESSSGGSTTVSANSSPGESPPATSLPPTKEEEEPPPPTPQLRVLPPEVSPRKKPRKQQLTGNQITEPTFSEDEMEFISEEKNKKETKEESEAKVIPKRKTMSLLSSYKNLWKPRNNHFMRYTDVKAREEKVPSLSEIANQKYALQKINGWKIYHLGSQIEDVVSSEDEFIKFYDSLLDVLEINQKKNKNKDVDKEYSRINERVRANFQRTKVAKDQMLDAKVQMMKFFDHKNYVAELINKNISKRGGNKKRDRV